MHNGHLLHRIEAMCFGNFIIKPGGWIESESNLGETAWVADNAMVYDDAVVSDHAVIYGNAVVCAKVYGYAKVGDKAMVRGHAKIRGYAEVSGDALVHSYAIIGDHAIVTDSAKIGQNCTIIDYAFIGGSAELEEVTVKGFVKFDLPVTIDRHVTLFDSNDFVSVILQDKTYVYVKSIDTWFPIPPLNIKDSIEKL